MDPNACWLDVRVALENRDWPIAEETIQHLMQWIREGGFLPVDSPAGVSSNLDALSRKLWLAYLEGVLFVVGHMDVTHWVIGE